MINCSDYFIFKLRYYADKRILDRFGPSHTQHYERAKLSHEFLWALVEKVTNKKEEYWHQEYIFNSVECALEEIAETHGIHRWVFRDAYYTYFIPKEHIEIIEWIKLNIKSPYKILKKSSSGYVAEAKDLQYHRNASKIHTEEFKHKIFVSENTRKILTEKKIPWAKL